MHTNFPGTQCCEWYLWKIIIIISRTSTDTEKIQNWIIDKENNFIWHFKSNYPLLCQIKGGKLSQHFFLWAICINVTFPVTPVTDELIQCVSNMSTETRNWHLSVLLCHHVSTLPSSIFASFIVWKSSKNRLPVCDFYSSNPVNCFKNDDKTQKNLNSPHFSCWILFWHSTVKHWKVMDVNFTVLCF